MAKLVFALLCAAFALSAARQLHQTTALAKITDLPDNLQKLNARLTAAATSKVHPMSLLDHYEAWEKYEKYGQAYKPGYRADEEEQYYEADKYAPKYEAPEKYAPKYEAPEKYAPKYEDKYYEEVAVPHHPKEAYGDDEYAYEHKDKDGYAYGPSKVTVKLYEKYRSGVRRQTTNNNTFAFTSELTCTDPTAVKDIEHTHDGLITFPLMPDRTKLVTVGVCEWAVTVVSPQQISETAELKGSTQVVCTFNEEAERHCKSEYLCDKMTVSGQGLLYNFNALPEEPKYEKYDKYAPEKKYEKEEDAAAPAPVETMDVFLSLVTGVINTKKHMKWDHGAVQFFAGDAASTAAITPIKVNGGYGKKENPIGQYTMVFKH